MNNFKRLQEEELERVPDLRNNQRSVRNQLDNMRTVGNVVELYLTKILDLFVVMSGGRISTSDTRPSDHTGSPTDLDRRNRPSGGPSAG